MGDRRRRGESPRLGEYSAPLRLCLADQLFSSIHAGTTIARPLGSPYQEQTNAASTRYERHTSIQDHELHLRIQAESAEMPGMRLMTPTAFGDALFR